MAIITVGIDGAIDAVVGHATFGISMFMFVVTEVVGGSRFLMLAIAVDATSTRSAAASGTTGT